MHRARTSGLQGGNDAASGSAASGIARLLGYAAMPVFALMALWTALSGGQGDMLCLSMQGSSPMSGMAMMYLLMSVFHAGPWLRLVQRC
ncbi:MAG: hypothetical protein JSR72_00265 [Proteobacteria bacterium]|nr:hypothetical protein [Pseudomonadota bacterium]